MIISPFLTGCDGRTDCRKAGFEAITVDGLSGPLRPEERKHEQCDWIVFTTNNYSKEKENVSECRLESCCFAQDAEVKLGTQ